jgi:hypothetical protein
VPGRFGRWNSPVAEHVELHRQPASPLFDPSPAELITASQSHT